jgi:hypothetical protein
VTHAPVILVGRVEQIFGLKHESMFRLFRVTVEESLKGDVKNSPIYLVLPPPSDSLNHEPPILFPARYLLFLSLASNPIAYQDLHMLVAKNIPIRVYSIYADWKGAVSLDSRWRERSNKKIEMDYGYDSLEELTAVVRSACEYMRASDDEKKKLAEKFRKQGGVYKQFIDDAAGERAEAKP